MDVPAVDAKSSKSSAPAMPAPVKAAPLPAPKPVASVPAAPKTGGSSSASSGKSATSNKAATSSKSSKSTSSKAAAKKKDDDDDDDDDKPAVKGTAASTSASAAAKKAEAKKAAERKKEKEEEPEPEPPQTLVELFSRMTAPEKSPPKNAPAGPAAVVPAAKPAAPVWGQTKVVTSKGGAVTVAPAKAPATAGRPAIGTGTAIGGTMPVSIGAPSGRVVLASKMAPAAIATAASLGFKVAAPSATSSADPGLVRLVPPDGMSAAEARRVLAEAVPAGEFLRNLVYRPIVNAKGSADDGDPAAGRLGDSGDCTANRCYARDLLGWRVDRLGQCAQGVKIGVIDTGYDPNHPAFAGGRISLAKIEGSKTGTSPSWHGTGVLAILAGNPGSTTPGLIPQAQFLVADVFFADSRGQPMSDTYSVLQALQLMEKFDVNIVNLSLSGPRDPGVEQKIAQMIGNGVVFVAAAGNEGAAASPVYPAAYKGVIAVTAVNRDGFGYRHANQGDYIDVAAPGVGIWTAAPGRKETYLTGTSFATPYVTAIVAVLQSHGRGWSKERILEGVPVQDLGAPGRDRVFGRGLVKAPLACGPSSGSFETAVIRSKDARARAMHIKGPGADGR